MDKRVRMPSLLRLTDVSISNYLSPEDIADKKLIEQIDQSTLGDELLWDKIPRIFTSLDEWPIQTNLKCFQCDFTFNDIPKFIPTYINIKNSKEIEIGVFGNMCSFQCAELWCQINLTKDKLWTTQENLCLLYFLFYGYYISNIKTAPLKTELLQYGGIYDDLTFKKKIQALMPEHDINSNFVPENERINTFILSQSKNQPNKQTQKNIWGN